MSKTTLEKIMNFPPETDTHDLADILGIDEDEVIAAIHSSKRSPNPHDTIDAWLRVSESNPAGQVPTGRWADKFIKTASPHAATDFFEIRKRDPFRRKYKISDDCIVVRKWIEGDFFDVEYPRDDEIAELILSLRKS